MGKTILVINDDASTLDYLKETLPTHGYKVYTSQDGIDALHQVKEKKPDMVLLDMDLPNSDLTGESVCREIKKLKPQLPVIILSARNSAKDVVRSFDLGADDFISKPFDIEELVARVKARMFDKKEKSVYKLQDLKIDDLNKRVFVKKREIHLTPREYDLLLNIIQNKERVLLRDVIISKVWSSREDIDDRVVDVYIGYIRKKLDPESLDKYIRTVRGFGYQAVK